MNLNFYSYVGQNGSRNPSSKINEDVAHNICILLSTTTLSLEQIARRTKSTHNIVREIARGKNWTHVSQYYQFKDRRPAWMK